MATIGATHKARMIPIDPPGHVWRVDMFGKVDPISKHGAR